jgi:Ca-activated chloride channel homolog
MSLSWPWALLALVAFPLLWGVRWYWRRRRRRGALRMSTVAMVKAALPQRASWRRRLPIALFAAGLVVLGVGGARPRATVIVPSDASAIMLAVDVSSSMCSTDVSPNRITAAEKAAGDFVKAQHDGTRIGLVAFSGVAALLVPPTTDKAKLLSAIGQLRTSRGTAIGLGILTAVDAIAQINPAVPASGVDLPAPAAGSGPQGYQPDTIVVLTDGANTQGVDPVTAAGQAAARGLRVYTIGFGTTNPAAFVCTADQISGGSGFGGPGRGGFGGGFGGAGGGGPGGRNALEIDEDALSQVATITGAQYFQAQDAEQLTDTLVKLPSVIELAHQRIELTVWFALAGAVLVLAAVGLTQWWSRPSSYI